MIYMSELLTEQFTRSERYFVINDLEGRVPHVHAISDLAVIAGPINSVEALQSGTPTVIIANERLREEYERSAYRLLNQSSVERGAVIASGRATLAKAMRAVVVHRHDPNVLLKAKTVREKTTNDFLDHLENVVSSAWEKSTITLGDAKARPLTLESFK